MNYLGDIIRRRRKALNMTQSEACRLLFGYRGGFVSDVERGNKSVPIERLPDLVRVFGETTEYWRRVVLLSGALRRLPDEARRMHHALELLADLHVNENWDVELGFELAGWLKERMGR